MDSKIPFVDVLKADGKATPRVGLDEFEYSYLAEITNVYPLTSKDKLYQVRLHNANSLTLSQPLSHNVSINDQVYYSAQLSGQWFSGVFGKFYNEDFGNPVNRTEDGIIGNIGPLSLKEKL